LQLKWPAFPAQSTDFLRLTTWLVTVSGKALAAGSLHRLPTASTLPLSLEQESIWKYN